ncbi:MAG: hypothetical protein LBS57_04425 [Treponema sp.]|jgi:hypothetical protein|nr:hypothetical protein [Treponema sp.]
MAETKDYLTSLSEALQLRRDWLEKEDLVKLKEDLRVFQSSFSSLYTIYLKKGLINEDPYKQEAKIGELEIPDTGAFNEAERLDQLSIRLSNYDNQMDFLVNFYQFSVDFLNLERIKRILGLVRYVDWIHLTPDSISPITKVVAEITIQSKIGIDQIGLSVISESLGKLSGSTASVINSLKRLSAYYRENYKLEVRKAVTGNLSPPEANIANIKKKFAAAMPGKPFYQEFIEEIIKEDYSGRGPALKENILKSLHVAEEKPQVVKQKTSFKTILLDGLQVVSSVTSSLGEISAKIDSNETLLANRKKGFWEKVRLVFQQMMNKEPDEVIYELEYMDATKGIPVKEKLNFHRFRSEMEKKSRNLASMGTYGASKPESMSEEQLITILERAIRDVQSLHHTLTALDEYFKLEAPRESRGKIKGIKPELAAIKNAIIRSNQLRHEYSAQEEEEEQMRRLGIEPGV